jgi:hypothetical protein
MESWGYADQGTTGRKGLTMAATPAFRIAPPTYSQQSEDQFRRELENILMVALALAENVAAGRASIMTHTIKRHQYQPPVGLAIFI